MLRTTVELQHLYSEWSSKDLGIALPEGAKLLQSLRNRLRGAVPAPGALWLDGQFGFHKLLDIAHEVVASKGTGPKEIELDFGSFVFCGYDERRRIAFFYSSPNEDQALALIEQLWPDLSKPDRLNALERLVYDWGAIIVPMAGGATVTATVLLDQKQSDLLTRHIILPPEDCEQLIAKAGL